MSQMSTPGAGPSRSSGENDIYTALMFVAFLFVLTATAYVGYKAMMLFGAVLPPGGS